MERQRIFFGFVGVSEHTAAVHAHCCLDNAENISLLGSGLPPAFIYLHCKNMRPQYRHLSVFGRFQNAIQCIFMFLSLCSQFVCMSFQPLLFWRLHGVLGCYGAHSLSAKFFRNTSLGTEILHSWNLLTRAC